MNDFDIRNIFCDQRLRRLNAETVAPRKSSSTSKESLKRSMGALLSEIVSSLSPDSAHSALELDAIDQKILH